MTKDAQLKRNRRNKLNPRAEISYLVGYDSTNIYRIWIPHTGKVISTRDVIFDETKFFNGKRTDLKDAYNTAQEERFADFYTEKLISAYHGAFVAGIRFKDPKMHKRNLPPLPESNRDLETHPFRD